MQFGEHRDQFVAARLLGQPADVARQVEHRHARVGPVGAARVGQHTIARLLVACDGLQHLGRQRVVAHAGVERFAQAPDAVEVQARLADVALQQPLHERQLGGHRAALVGELAHVQARRPVRIGRVRPDTAVRPNGVKADSSRLLVRPRPMSRSPACWK